MAKHTELRICMGSACHQKGVTAVLAMLERLMADSSLDDSVELKGAFCLGPCVEGIVMQLGEQQFTRISPANIAERFAQEILPAIRRQLDAE